MWRLQVAKLHALLKPHLLRRLKADVLRKLPPKRELLLRVELTPLQKRCYRSILTQNLPTLTVAGMCPPALCLARCTCNTPAYIF